MPGSPGSQRSGARNGALDQQRAGLLPLRNSEQRCNDVRYGEKRSCWRKRDRGTIGEQLSERVHTEWSKQTEGAKRWDWPVLLWPPRRTPIARMRAKVKLRQVVTPRLPLWSPRHETSCAHPCRVPYCSFFSPLAERTPLPRGHVLPAPDDLRLWGPRGTAIARLGAKHAVLAAVAMVRDRFRGCG